VAALLAAAPAATSAQTEPEDLVLRLADLGPGYVVGDDVESGPCPERRRDRVLAHVHLEGAVVTVNIPICYVCIAVRARDNPYTRWPG
jgi:hypothetical protein